MPYRKKFVPLQRQSKGMIEVHDIIGNLLYTDCNHSDTSELWCDGIDLRKADFNGWDLSGAYFSDCDLREAVFDGANLEEANLSCCNVESASFRGANLLNADIWGVELDDADTEDAILPCRSVAYYR